MSDFTTVATAVLARAKAVHSSFLIWSRVSRIAVSDNQGQE